MADDADDVNEQLVKQLSELIMSFQGLGALLSILHQRVCRIEDFLTATDEEIMAGTRPHIGITEEEHLALINLNLALAKSRGEDE